MATLDSHMATKGSHMVSMDTKVNSTVTMVGHIHGQSHVCMVVMSSLTDCMVKGMVKNYFMDSEPRKCLYYGDKWHFWKIYRKQVFIKTLQLTTGY